MTGYTYLHCQSCGQATDTAGRCPSGCGNVPTPYGELLVAEPSAEKLREVAALERIAELLGSIDDTLRSMADRDPRSW